MALLGAHMSIAGGYYKAVDAAAALGMDVVTWSPRMTPERAAELGAQAVSLDALLSTSLVVSLHLVPADGTRGPVDLPRRRAAPALAVADRQPGEDDE